MTTLYGIKNCDTVKKAQKYLAQQQIDYQFHDFRTDGIDAALLTQWLTSLSSEQLINKRSTTYRALSAEDKQRLEQGDIIALCLAVPTLIKRPVLQYKQQLYIGFSEKNYNDIFASKE